MTFEFPTIANLARRIKRGEPVTSIAAEIGCTPSAVYARLRKASIPARAIKSCRNGKESRPITGFPGYYVDSSGRVFSCVSTSGKTTGYWRELASRVGSHGRGWPCVQIGGRKNRMRMSIATLIRSAWGADAEKVLRKAKKRIG